MLSWLQSTLSNEILSHVLGYSHANQLWDKLFSYFQKQTCARACQLKVELCDITINNLTIQDYLLKIRAIVDALAFIGDPISCSHQIVMIFEGLYVDYAPVVSIIEQKFGVMDLDEV